MTPARLALLLCLAAGCGRSRDSEPRMLGLVPARPLEDQLSAERTTLLEAKSLVRARHWEAALMKLKALQDQSPAFAQGVVDTYIAEVQKEAIIDGRIRSANAHLDAHELVPAANDVAHLTGETLQGVDLAQVRARIAIAVSELAVEGQLLLGDLKAPEKRTRLAGICDTLVRVAPGEKSLAEFQRALAAR